MIHKNKTRALIILAGAALALFFWISLLGDLRDRPVFYLIGFLALSGIMFLAYRLVSTGSRRAWQVALVAAFLFRLVVVAGAPTMSDDVYRYVWDGRVQHAGYNPYAFSPKAPELSALQDENWERINNPEIGTIYPAAAQLLFRVLAGVGAGVHLFRAVFGLFDFCVVLALVALLRKMKLPPARVVFYAWNPLAVFESAGSGHVEPVGTFLMILAVVWLIGKGRSPSWSAATLAISIQIKLFSLALVPGMVRRMKLPAVLVLVMVSVGLLLPYALTGPVTGEGLSHYAERWERNGLLYDLARNGFDALDTGNNLKPSIASLVDRFGDDPIPWTRLYHYVWPRELAKGLMALLALAWILRLTFRPGLHPAAEGLWVMGGLIFLLPTVHPWYYLWVLPFAAALASPGWLLLGVTVSLAYVGSGENVSWWLRAVEYGVPLMWILSEAYRVVISRPIRANMTP